MSDISDGMSETREAEYRLELEDKIEALLFKLSAKDELILKQLKKKVELFDENLELKAKNEKLEKVVSYLHKVDAERPLYMITNYGALDVALNQLNEDQRIEES